MSIAEVFLVNTFFQNALIAASLSAIVCGLIGTYIVVRRIVFVSGGITHASFSGLGIGVFLGINPLFVAGITAMLSALGISYISKNSEMREDSAIASIWALGMAIGILFMSLTPGYTTGLSSYLFGNILLVSRVDLLSLLFYTLFLILLLTFFYRPIYYSIFDIDFLETRGISAKKWNIFMLLVVSVALVLSIRLVGIMLLMSLLTLPQAISNLFTSNLHRIAFFSILIAFLANVGGLALSYFFAVPSGVVIVLLLSLSYVLARFSLFLKKTL